MDAQIKKSEKRAKNGKASHVRFTPAERKIAEAKAAQVGLSIPGLARVLVLGYSPLSEIDSDDIQELILLKNDQNRLGNLLKMWLSNKDKSRPFSTQDIHQLIAEIDDLMEQIEKKISEL
ncbi:MAG: hypothetical protein GY705_25225 [Bacteroidetes bacterium]|nr:hypothetical protein [Bacteroidota bacterium]